MTVLTLTLTDDSANSLVVGTFNTVTGVATLKKDSIIEYPEFADRFIKYVGAQLIKSYGDISTNTGHVIADYDSVVPALEDLNV